MNRKYIGVASRAEYEYVCQKVGWGFFKVFWMRGERWNKKQIDQK